MASAPMQAKLVRKTTTQSSTPTARRPVKLFLLSIPLWSGARSDVAKEVGQGVRGGGGGITRTTRSLGQLDITARCTFWSCRGDQAIYIAGCFPLVECLGGEAGGKGARAPPLPPFFFLSSVEGVAAGASDPWWATSTK